jgi:type VI secretion system protein ImpK
LDEINVDAPNPWGTQWREHALELTFYRMAERAWNFWDQARKAETHKEGEPLEAFFLCVMLGFRGQRREDPEKLQNWAGTARTQMARNQPEVFPKVDETEPPTYVPPLNARERMQRMLVINGALLLVLILLGSFILMNALLQ